jgi:hypothetical protein
VYNLLMRISYSYVWFKGYGWMGELRREEKVFVALSTCGRMIMHVLRSTPWASMISSATNRANTVPVSNREQEGRRVRGPSTHMECTRDFVCACTWMRAVKCTGRSGGVRACIKSPLYRNAFIHERTYKCTHGAYQWCRSWPEGSNVLPNSALFIP